MLVEELQVAEVDLPRVPAGCRQCLEEACGKADQDAKYNMYFVLFIVFDQKREKGIN
jgi:hypothetical protein